MLEIAVLSLTALVNLLLGLLVYRKNPESATNRFFFMLTSTFVVWSIINFASVHPVGLSQLWLIRSVLFCGAFLNLAVFLSFLAFPSLNLSDKNKKWVKRAVWWTVFTMLLTLTPLVFKELKHTGTSVQPVPNPGIGLFLLHTVVLIGASIFLIIKKFRSARGATKNQLRLVLFGITGTFSLIVITNFLLVILFNFTGFVPLGPALTLIFSGSFAYAIIRHHLFDIRAAAARAMAYILSLGTIAGGYGLVIFGISEGFFHNTTTNTIQRAVYISLAVFSSLFYSRIKTFFDKVTNRIFYQDAYEPQKFLDELNEVLVVNIELEKLLTDTIYVIQQNLKTSFCVFTIRETSYFPRRFVGDPGKKFKVEDIEEINNAHAHIRDKVIVNDLLEENDRELKRILDKYDVSVLVRLVPTLDYEIQGLGHILFGAKKSGNPFNKQDLQILEIIANELVIAVQNGLRFEEIEKFNATLQEKIDDATHKLKKTNEKLQALDETKDEFISMASHQLRTPLTSVKGYLSMVLEGDAGETNEMQKKLLDQAFVSSQRMVYLIADLLNVSRLRTGKFVIEPIPTNLAEVIEGETGQLKETAKARGLTLIYEKPEKFPTLMLDETKIRQVIMNFMDNAIYYAKPNGTVKVELRDTGKTVEFMVVDDGIGVPKSEQHHLFTKFYRAGNAKKARPDGTGLGLFMAKKVIVAQGGSIIFKSEEGKGSTFGFAFAKDKLSPSTVPTDKKA